MNRFHTVSAILVTGAVALLVGSTQADGPGRDWDAAEARATLFKTLGGDPPRRGGRPDTAATLNKWRGSQSVRATPPTRMPTSSRIHGVKLSLVAFHATSASGSGMDVTDMTCQNNAVVASVNGGGLIGKCSTVGNPTTGSCSTLQNNGSGTVNLCSTGTVAAYCSTNAGNGSGATTCSAGGNNSTQNICTAQFGTTGGNLCSTWGTLGTGGTCSAGLTAGSTNTQCSVGSLALNPPQTVTGNGSCSATQTLTAAMCSVTNSGVAGAMNQCSSDFVYAPNQTCSVGGSDGNNVLAGAGNCSVVAGTANTQCTVKAGAVKYGSCSVISGTGKCSTITTTGGTTTVVGPVNGICSGTSTGTGGP